MEFTVVEAERQYTKQKSTLGCILKSYKCYREKQSKEAQHFKQSKEDSLHRKCDMWQRLEKGQGKINVDIWGEAFQAAKQQMQRP